MTPAQPSGSPGLDWRTPAIVIVAGCTMTLLIFGVRAGFGLFLPPMSEAHGWGRDVFGLAMAIQNLIWGIGQPVAGMVADRYGSGRVLAVGGAAYALGVFLMSQSTTPLAFHLSAGLVVGFALASTSFGVVLASMGRMVPPEKRTWALGLGTATGSLGMFLIAPVGQTFIAAFGWQIALMLLALFAFMLVPLAGVMAGRPPAVSGPAQSMGEALREAFGHGGYRYLLAGFFVCGFHVTFIQVHMPAFISDQGLGGNVGAWALALIGLFNVIGSYTAGVLGSRHSKKNLLALLYLSRAVAIAIYVTLPITVASTLAFSAAIGLMWLSTVPLTSGLVAQIFGPRYMATLFGFVFFSHQVGAFLGVWLGGWAFDNLGAYDLVWWISIGLGVLAALVHLPIDERPVMRPAPAD